MPSHEFLRIIRLRLTSLSRWIGTSTSDTALSCKHLDAGSVERLYWHLGYYNALKDVERLHQNGLSGSMGIEWENPLGAPGGRNCH